MSQCIKSTNTGKTKIYYLIVISVDGVQCRPGSGQKQGFWDIDDVLGLDRSEPANLGG